MKKFLNIRLVSNPEILRKLVSKPSFKGIQIFNEDLVAIENLKTKVLLNRPIYTGFIILDLAKMVMAEFHYNVMKKRYGERVKLLFTDTDSFCHEISTQNWKKDLSGLAKHFDFSNYPPDDDLYNTENASVPGLMKDETKGNPIVEFVGLKPKMYSLKYRNTAKKTAKGIKKSVIENELTHEHYRNCLFNQKKIRSTMNMIRSKNHELYIESVNKYQRVMFKCLLFFFPF